MQHLFSIKKILVFTLFVAIMFIIISMFSIYSKDEVTIKEGILVDAEPQTDKTA